MVMVMLKYDVWTSNDMVQIILILISINISKQNVEILINAGVMVVSS